MNIFTCVIVSFIAFVYLIELVADILNLRCITNKIPAEFKGFYDKKKYKKSQDYLKATTKFSLICSTVFVVIEIAFVLLGGFNYIDKISRSLGFNEIFTGLIFIGIIFFAVEIIKIPFSFYNVFVIEEKFGFNKMNVKTFFCDLLKNWLVMIVLGTIILSLIIWFFKYFGNDAWVYAFTAFVAFELIMTFIYPVTILPLFNKFEPLPKGKLKTSIEKYAKKESFKMKGLFTMDNSKRSSKSNAFFAGFGRFRRIVLFDTLIQKHTVEELTSVLAHEMGHFKLGHIIKEMILSFCITGLMFFLLSLFINSPWLFKAFFMENSSVYAGIVFFGFLYMPVSLIMGVLTSKISRKYEFEADAYAVKTYKKPKSMINALKKLSVDNLSNLYPSKFKVFLEYSHPPTLERIKAIKNLMK